MTKDSRQVKIHISPTEIITIRRNINGKAKYRVQRGENMIRFEEEIKKFKPCAELAEVEDVIYKYETKDIVDVLNEMIEELKEEKSAHE